MPWIGSCATSWRQLLEPQLGTQVGRKGNLERDTVYKSTFVRLDHGKVALHRLSDEHRDAMPETRVS